MPCAAWRGIPRRSAALPGIWASGCSGSGSPACKEQGNYKIAHLPIVLFENTSPLLAFVSRFFGRRPRLSSCGRGRGRAFGGHAFLSALPCDAERRYDIIAFGEKLNKRTRLIFGMVQGKGKLFPALSRSRAYADEAGALALSRGQRRLLPSYPPRQTREFESALVLGRRVLLRTDAAKLWDDSKESLPNSAPRACSRGFS